MSDFVEVGMNDRQLRQTASIPGSLTYINEAGVPESIVGKIRQDRQISIDIANEIESWSQSLANGGGETSWGYDWFNRTRWDNKRHTFAIMSKCAWSVENDDVLSTLADVLEAQMFSKCRFEMFDNDEEDVWNQWAKDVDLDTQLRAIARELFKVSQVYVAMWWDRKVYKVRTNGMDATLDDFERELEAKKIEDMKKNAELQGMPMPEMPEPPKGQGKGNRTRKKQFPVEVPTAFTILDPLKVLPVGNLMFGREQFAYIATRSEADAFDAALTGEIADSTVLQLIQGRYQATGADRAACAELGIDWRNLFLFRPGAVFRHALTKANYERFSPVRLKSILQILDMKDHLRSSDRASLVGNTNFIVVIKKGSDKWPARAAEVENLRDQARVIARLPVLVGDHRLSVEIVAPPLDNTLIESRWQVLDARLVFRSLQTFTPLVQGGNSSGAGVSEMSRIVSKGLESRRHMIMRSLERHVFDEIMKRNEGVLEESPDLAFTPRRISLDFDTDIVNAILKLRDRGDISRETALEELDFDQDTEVVRRAEERLHYDQVFQSGTPFSSPAMNPFGAQQPGQPGQPAQPGQPKAPAPAGTMPEGGRPPGVKETKPRTPKGTPKA